MKVNITDYSWSKLVNIAEKCGFQTREGGKHTKVKTSSGEFITTIPRKNRLNKYTIGGIIKAFQKFNCKISFE